VNLNGINFKDMVKGKFKIKCLLIVGLILIFINIYFIDSGLAQLSDYSEIHKQADALRQEAGFEEYSQGEGVGKIIAMAIKGFLSLLGVIFIILILIVGYNWMTAAGDEEKIKKAKDTLRRAIIGLLIVVSAYAITYFVFTYLPWGGGGISGPT
jgi:amino acid transporter